MPPARPPSGSPSRLPQREDDTALATALAERKRDLDDPQLVDLDEMARRVDVDLDTLP